MATEIEIAWLAGLLDAEGSFYYHRTYTVQLVMIDKDVVTKAARIFPHGNSKVNFYLNKLPRKPTFRICWYGDNAKKLMAVIYPYMSNRRKNKIVQLLGYTPPLGERINDIAWFAGLAEGECWFGTGKRNPLIVQLKMCDKDVIKYAASVFPLGSRAKITIPNYDNKPKHWSQIYCIKWYGEKARILMEAILPYMGERRTKKITECLAAVCK